ncbi:MAG: hypothetical protein K0S65_802 [Labilithrix sp.]|nr:hypothetical protein [Labilithrix sp.]
MIGATLAVAAFASGAQAHRRHAASRALDRYARSRGVVFVPAPASPRGASPRVVGSKDGVDWVVELFRLGNEVRTRVASVAPRNQAPVLSVLQRGAFLLTRAPASRIGDQSLDQRYVVASGAAHDIEEVSEDSRPLLVLDERCRGVWLASDGHKVTVSWRGMESDPIVLDAARDLVVRIASVCRPAMPYR